MLFVRAYPRETQEMVLALYHAHKTDSARKKSRLAEGARGALSSTCNGRWPCSSPHATWIRLKRQENS